jgi:hypothetical protein
MKKITKTVDQALVYAPKPDITTQELSEILRLVVFHTYPPEMKTQENLTALFNQLPTGAQRHFELKDPQ